MASAPLVKNGISYITAKAAAPGAGISADYITKLCRKGEVNAVVVGTTWYVDEASLAEFVARKEAAKKVRAELNARQLKEAARRAQTAKSEADARQRVPLSSERQHIENQRRRAAAFAGRVSRRNPAYVFALATLVLLATMSVGTFALSTLKQQSQLVVAAAATLPTPIQHAINRASMGVFNFVCPLFSACDATGLAQNQTQPLATSQALPAPNAATTSHEPDSAWDVGDARPLAVIERVVERTETIIQGATSGITGDLLDARLAALETYLAVRIDQVAYQGDRQAENLADSFADGIGGSGFADVDISDSTWTGGSILNTAILNSSVAATSLSASILCISDECRSAWPTDTSFSTTSADYWETQQAPRNIGFSTTSADHWKIARDFFSTSSASYFASVGLAFSTTSADAWQTERNFFATTSVDYWRSVTDLFSTTSTNALVHSSTTIAKTYAANAFTSLQTFQNASATAISASYASSTQGIFGILSVGTLSGFLKATAGAIATAAIDLASDVTGILSVARGGTGWATVEAGSLLYGNGSSPLATTTVGTSGQVLALVGNVPTWVATSTLVTISGTLDVGKGGTGATSFGYGLVLSPGGASALTNIATSSLGLLTTNVAEGSNLYYTDGRVQTYLGTLEKGFFFSTTSADYYAHSSSTIPKLYSSNAWTGNNSFSTLTLGSLNGPLHANAGVVAATTSIGVLYGGTGLASTPSYGQLLVGNSSGGYTLTATSSLGLGGGSSDTGNVPAGTIAAFASTTCPSGWTEYQPARGRFLRGIDNGAGNDPAGTRAPGNVQEDAFQGHWHNGRSGYGGGGDSTRWSREGSSGNTSNSNSAVREPTSDGVNGTPRTDVETRPKNVAVLFCEATGSSALQNGTIASGTSGQIPFYAANGTALAATSSLFMAASGNVGIGTTTPTAKLHVSGSNAVAAITRADGTRFAALGDTGATDDGGLFLYNSSGSLQSVIRAQNDSYIQGGNLGIGTTTPPAKLSVWGDMEIGAGNTANLRAYNTSRNSNGFLTLYDGSNGNITLGTTFSTGDVILSPGASGKVGIASSSPWKTLSVVGTMSVNGLTLNTGAASASLCLSSSNEVTRNTDNESCITSSARYKHDIQSLIGTTTLETLLALRPVSFEYNGTRGVRYGLIAEEVNSIDPTLVGYDDQGMPNSVRYTSIVPLLVRALQDLANIAGQFKENLVAWLGNATNGITDLFAKNLYATNVAADRITANQELCVGQTCITEAQFMAVFDQTAAATTPASAPPMSSNDNDLPVHDPEQGPSHGASASTSPSGSTESEHARHANGTSDQAANDNTPPPAEASTGDQSPASAANDNPPAQQAVAI